ncbi:MAG: hypothetical protein AAF360_05725 [Pseudomonadota bacterium]
MGCTQAVELDFRLDAHGIDGAPLAELPTAVARLVRSKHIGTAECVGLAQFLFDLRTASGVAASPGLRNLIAYGTTIQRSGAPGENLTGMSVNLFSRLIVAQNAMTDEQSRIVYWVAVEGRSLRDYAEIYFNGRLKDRQIQARQLLVEALGVLAECYAA